MTWATCKRSGVVVLKLLSVSLLLMGFVGELAGCSKSNSSVQSSAAAAPVAQDVIGLTEAELRSTYPAFTELDGSFRLLVSKNLHPYQAPATHKFLRFGSAYLVAELKDGKVIALHQVHG